VRMVMISVVFLSLVAGRSAIVSGQH